VGSGFDNALRVINLPSGIIDVFAGNYIEPTNETQYGEGNQATAASIAQPWSIWADTVGTVYLTTDMHNIRRVDGRNGTITTIAGERFSSTPALAPMDGYLARDCYFGITNGLWGDSQGKYLLFTDWNGNNVRSIDLATNVLGTFAGRASWVNFGDTDGGSALEASFQGVHSVWGDNRGNVFLVDCHNFLIRRVTDGVIYKVAGQFQKFGSNGGEGVATNVTLSFNAEQVSSCL
jgi:hypothetical protein